MFLFQYKRNKNNSFNFSPIMRYHFSLSKIDHFNLVSVFKRTNINGLNNTYSVCESFWKQNLSKQSGLSAWVPVIFCIQLFTVLYTSFTFNAFQSPTINSRNKFPKFCLITIPKYKSNEADKPKRSCKILLSEKKNWIFDLISK